MARRARTRCKGCDRVGEAKNPGPGVGNSQVRQAKLADYGIGVHVDARADWCRARGFEIERVRGDGNCLYTALGRSVGRDQGDVRSDIAGWANQHWADIVDIGAVYSLADFFNETSEIGVWGGEAQIIVWATATGRKVVVHSLGDIEKVYGEGPGTHLLYSNYNRWGDQPNHFDHLRRVGENNVVRNDVGKYCREPEECEGGTVICTVNVSGEKDQLVETMRMGPHIILLQEHRAGVRELGAWKSLAKGMGWHGVWATAVEDGRGRSGGVAILVNVKRPVFMVGECSNRIVGAAVAPTRRKVLNVYNVYGWDCHYKNNEESNHQMVEQLVHRVIGLGRTMWVIGGDWNMEPGEVELKGLPGDYYTLEAGEPTCSSGRQLDCFIGSPAFTGEVGAWVDPEGSRTHRAVFCKLHINLDGDIGSRARRPQAFRGIT